MNWPFLSSTLCWQKNSFAYYRTKNECVCYWDLPNNFCIIDAPNRTVHWIGFWSMAADKQPCDLKGNKLRRCDSYLPLLIDQWNNTLFPHWSIYTFLVLNIWGQGKWSAQYGMLCTWSIYIINRGCICSSFLYKSENMPVSTYKIIEWYIHQLTSRWNERFCSLHSPLRML